MCFGDSPRTALAVTDSTLEGRVHARAEAQYLHSVSEMRAPRMFVYQLIAGIAMAAFAAVPGASVVFGEATPVLILLLVTPSFVAWVVTSVAFRVGPYKRFLFLERIESAVNFGVCLALVHVSGSDASPLWVLPFAMWFVDTQGGPIEAKEWLPPIPAYSIYVLIRLAEGDTAGAAMGITMFLAALSFAVLIKQGRVALLRASVELSIAQEATAKALLHEQRRQIAADIHDGAAADVIALLRSARRADRTSDEQAPSDLTANAERALDSLRSAVTELRDGESYAGYEVACDLCERIRRVAGACTLELRTTLSCVLDATSRQALVFAIAEVALNASKYAGLDNFVLRVEETGDVLQATLNGPGVAPSASDLSHSRGLEGVVARVSAVSGRFDVDQKQSSVTISVPCSPNR